jgi:hypothetical protein
MLASRLSGRWLQQVFAAMLLGMASWIAVRTLGRF